MGLDFRLGRRKGPTPEHPTVGGPRVQMAPLSFAQVTRNLAPPLAITRHSEHLFCWKVENFTP